MRPDDDRALRVPGDSAASLRRTQTTVLEGTPASRRVLERCRFKQEGLLRAYRWVDGAPRDALLFSHVPGGG